MGKPRPFLCHSPGMAQNNIVKDTAARIPDVVREAFSSSQSLSVRDILLLESADVTFFATGAKPTFREMSSVYWLIADKRAFQAAVESGDFSMQFDKWAETVSPSSIMQVLPSVTDILTRTFQPMEDAEKKPQKGETPKP